MNLVLLMWIRTSALVGVQCNIYSLSLGGNEIVPAERKVRKQTERQREYSFLAHTYLEIAVEMIGRIHVYGLSEARPIARFHIKPPQGTQYPCRCSRMFWNGPTCSGSQTTAGRVWAPSAIELWHSFPKYAQTMPTSLQLHRLVRTLRNIEP